MKTLNLQAYKELRENLYKQAGIIGDAAERFENLHLERAYDHVSTALDSIEELGHKLGYLDAGTNEYIDEVGEASAVLGESTKSEYPDTLEYLLAFDVVQSVKAAFPGLTDGESDVNGGDLVDHLTRELNKT